MDEIMTLEEVAKYLRVSERTVYDWAQKGDIPGGKLGTSWRFKRVDIEAWVNSKLEQTPAEPQRTTHYAETSLSEVLSAERVVLLDVNDKESALKSLVEVLAESPLIKKKRELEEAICRREKLMSTGIGFGIGVPHVRIGSVKDLVMAIAICRNPIEDYESLDSEPIHIICMVAANKEQHAKYIRTLSAISSTLKNIETRKRLLDCQSSQEAYAILTEG
ncbi:PTS sugar transporter subunit IIA [Verrucomicrobiota bacterium]